jgi:hypothetical protein
VTFGNGWGSMTTTDQTSRPSLRQTLAVSMRALGDVGPLVALYPSPENFTAPDQGQAAPVIAWTEVYVYTRRGNGYGGVGGESWVAVPRNPVPSFTQMLGMGYT